MSITILGKLFYIYLRLFVSRKIRTQPNVVLLNRYLSLIIISLYSVYKKGDLIKSGNETIKKGHNADVRIILRPTYYLL